VSKALAVPRFRPRSGWLCLFAVALGTSASARDPVDRWRVTTRIDLGGLALPDLPNMPPGLRLPAPPPQVQEICTPRRADAAPVADHDGRCTVSDVHREGERQTVHLDCGGARALHGTLELVYDSPDHYVGRMEVAPERADARARLPPHAVTLVMEGQRIGQCEAGDTAKSADQENPRQERTPQVEARDACTQSALAAEFEAFLGAHPRCQERTAVRTFCGAVQEFDGFLGAATREADAMAPGAAQAATATITQPLTLAARLCDFSIPEVRLGLCERAGALGRFDFLLGQCAAQSRSLAQRLCPVGAAPGAGAEDFCARYSAQATRAGTTPVPAPKTVEP